MSKAKYWTKAWNPVVGCRKASEGCQNCYAERITERFGINGGDFTPRQMSNSNPPKSGVVFVGNMTDLFGDWNSREQIRDWLAQLSRSAINMVLTKRAERMAEVIYPGAELPHVWWGVTAENQTRADERIPHLLSVKPLESSFNSNDLRINRWLSLEPLLGSLDIIRYIGFNAYKCACGWHETERNLILSNPKNNGLWGWCQCRICGERAFQSSSASWVVVGAESGPNRRPCQIEWVRSIVAQCQAAGVPVFVKQLDLDGKLVTDINQFPEDLRIREIPWSKQ